MVSYVRGDVADPAARHAVLASYTPQATTVYNTTADLLADPSITDVSQVCQGLQKGKLIGQQGLAWSSVPGQ